MFKTPDLGLRGTDRPADARQQAGRSIANNLNAAAADERAAGQDVGNAITIAGQVAVDYIDHQEISHGAAQFAVLGDQLSKQWDQTLEGSNPNDPAVAAKFRESVVEPAIERFREGFSTRNSQAWAESHVNRLREHFWTKTAADQSSLAAIAVRDNLRQIGNSFSSMAASDPASIDFALAQADDALQGILASSPTLSPEAKMKVHSEISQQIKESIISAGITAAINKNPEAGLKMAQRPQFAPYLDGEKVNSFYAEAKRAEKADAVLARQIREETVKANTEKNSIAILEDMFSENPTVSAKQILSLPDDQMTYERRKDLVSALEKRSGETPVAKAQANAVRMITDVHAGKIQSQDDIVKALAAGEIDYERFKQVQKEFLDLRSPEGNTLANARGEFLKQYQPIVNPWDENKGGRTEDGYRRAYQLQQFARLREEELRKAGQDPHTLYDPRSPTFIGNTPFAKPKTSAQLLQGIKSETYGPPSVKLATPSATASVKPAPGASDIPPKPTAYPDAQWSDKLKAWVVQKDGAWFKVTGDDVKPNPRPTPPRVVTDRPHPLGVPTGR